MATEEAAYQYQLQMHYRIGEASAQLGLQDKNSNTLRSWVEEFKDFLGASANPEPGKPRFFTEDDLRVLRTIRDLRAIHLPYNEIRARLEQGAHAVELQPTDPPPAEGQQVERVSPKEHAQLQALLAPMARAAEEWQSLAEQYRGRLEDREARVAALEQRVDGLQHKLEELYSSAIARAQSATPIAAPPMSHAAPTRRPKRRHWLFGL